MKNSTKTLVCAALIAALYSGLTYLTSFFGLAYGPVQFRASEALCVLAAFSPAAVWGLTVGCLISNIASFTPLDMLFGTAATLLAALCSYGLKKIKWGGLPILSFFCPVVFNALIIGAELTLFYTEGGSSLITFLITALWLALSEAVVVFALGIPLYLAVVKNRLLAPFFGVEKKRYL